MKRILSAALAFMLVFSLSVTALAADGNTVVDQGTYDSGKPPKTTVSCNVDPSYTVTVPTTTEVKFNQTETAFGKIELTDALLKFGYAVRVSIAPDGKLRNQENKTIAYTICSDGKAFTSAEYRTAGESTSLTIHITQQEWDRAYGGDYSDTVVFNISCEKTQQP